eukprot:6497890-Pyramimonas_sp.AAC.1
MPDRDSARIRCRASASRQADFCRVVLDPGNRLPQHAQCMRALSSIIDILSLGDSAVEHAEQLAAKIREHHMLMVVVYGVKSIK